ncbi:MAG: hypothetical protein U5K76_12815 [Woeseiaceae bacterium]|nr:hypothetical protein [Woeseiaceae bacterium]
MRRFARFVSRPWYWLAGKVFGTWARPTVQPDDPPALLADCSGEVCYVLETGGLADTLALERACRQHGLPSPFEAFAVPQRESSRVVAFAPPARHAGAATEPRGLDAAAAAGRCRRAAS